MYLKYIKCNLYFIFCCFWNVFCISITFSTVICIWNTICTRRVFKQTVFAFRLCENLWFLPHVKCLLSNASLEVSISLFMAALWNRALLYIFVLWFLLLSIFLFFLAYSQPSQIRCLPYFHTWCGPMRIWDAGLKRAARGSLKIQDAKIANNSPSGHHRTILSSCVFATKARIDSRKKLVKQQYLPHTFSQYGELRPTSG